MTYTMSRILRLFGMFALAMISFITPSTSDAKKRVVILETMTLPLIQDAPNWFRKGMADKGYIEGRDIEYIVLNARGKVTDATRLLQEEIKIREPDAVVSVATLASRAARNHLKGTDIPQVFMIVSSPEREGFIPHIGMKSASNITGTSHEVPTIAKMQVVAQALSQVVRERPFRIGILQSSYPSAETDASDLMAKSEAYPQFQMERLRFDYVPGAEGRKKMRDAAVRLIEERRDNIEMLWLATGPNQNDVEFVTAITDTGVPSVFANNVMAVELGTLIALDSNSEVNGLAASVMVDEILKGKHAGDIPISRTEKYLVAVNISTANRIGAIIPSDLLQLAGENIYK